VPSISWNLNQLQDDVRAAAQQCGRDPASVKILAVSKTFPPDVVEAAAEAGQLLFGENRIQEAIAKIPNVRKKGLVWHMIGHLQSNKARRAVELFDVIQTLDSEKIARKISSYSADMGKRMKVMIQVNIGEETQKSGFPSAEINEVISMVSSLPNLDLLGLMSIPPFFENPEETRPYFNEMFQLMADINRYRSEPLRELSMGMSADYRIAIEEGSTMVRIGTAIFGPRDR
jgi:pyridoxal phosphate enzyme (YggS family)